MPRQTLKKLGSKLLKNITKEAIHQQKRKSKNFGGKIFLFRNFD